MKKDTNRAHSRVISLGRHLSKSTQHLIQRDLDVIESGPTIIDMVVTSKCLGTDLSRLNVGHERVVDQRANCDSNKQEELDARTTKIHGKGLTLADEEMRAIILSFDDEFGLNDAVGCEKS